MTNYTPVPLQPKPIEKSTIIKNAKFIQGVGLGLLVLNITAGSAYELFPKEYAKWVVWANNAANTAAALVGLRAAKKTEVARILMGGLWTPKGQPGFDEEDFIANVQAETVLIPEPDPVVDVDAEEPRPRARVRVGGRLV